MTWLIVAILSYFLFAINSLGDKFLLIGKPSPKVYAFYVGLLSFFALGLILFVPFYVPSIYQIGFSFLTGFIFILSIFFLYLSLKKFEVSRIIPALGGFLPIFTLFLSFVFINQQGFLAWQKTASFVFLVLGSIFISLEKSLGFSLKSFFLAAVSAFFLSLYFVFSKIIYSDLGFWPGFIWIRLGVFFFALFLILFKDVRTEVFGRKKSFSRKTGIFFLGNQAVGAGALILQNWSIALAGAAYLSFVSALQGIQYVFLFIVTALISFKFPEFLKEGFSKRTILQKLLAIALIGAGLGLLVF